MLFGVALFFTLFGDSYWSLVLAVTLAEGVLVIGCRFVETTDNGSYGVSGFVTGPLEEMIDEYDMICACGPTPMLKNIAAAAKAHGKEWCVSLEQRIACEVGACLGCAVGIRRDDGSVTYKHVCKDGPVFRAEEVAW